MRRFGRRKDDLERVRVEQRGFDSLASSYAAQVVRYRRAMYQAINQIDADRPDIARRTLTAALRERWWQ